MTPVAMAIQRARSRVTVSRGTSAQVVDDVRAEVLSRPTEGDSKSDLGLQKPIAVRRDGWMALSDRFRSIDCASLSEGVESILRWKARGNGCRLLVTGNDGSKNRTTTLFAVAQRLVETSNLKVLIVDGQVTRSPAALERKRCLSVESHHGLDSVVELVPNRLWVASLPRLLADVRDEIAEREYTNRGSESELVTLIDGGEHQRVDRRVWLAKSAVDGVVDIDCRPPQWAPSAFEAECRRAQVTVVAVIHLDWSEVDFSNGCREAHHV